MNLQGYTQAKLAELDALTRQLKRARAKMGPSSLKSERFIWRITYRDVDHTQDSEMQGEGFARILADMVARIEILVPELSALQGNEVGIYHDIPIGAHAVFTRRRGIELHRDGTPAVYLPGWTIIGHEYPNGEGLYFFYHNQRDECFASSDFNDPRASA